MNKIKLLAKEFDGVTHVEETPTFRQDGGWLEASLDGPVGILPAGLWGKVPGGDPYLLHINVLTTNPMELGDIFELQSGRPMQPRLQYRPTPSNKQLVLVRPTDRLRLRIAPQQEIAVELLVESIGGVNELGSRLFEWSRGNGANDDKVNTWKMHGPGALPSWSGILHVVHDSALADVVTLPPRSLVPLDAMMTITRSGGGTPLLTPDVGDKLSGGMPKFGVTRAVMVMNNGEEWALIGA